MAMARLVYREICRLGSEGWAGEEFPYNNEAARAFAAYLLVPEDWAVKAARRPFISLEKLSESFQVPEYVMASRLAQLGKSVRGM
jgi:Zn-dependent peptidase ImmA (M78 family)